MNQRDPNKGIPASLLKRYEEASRERCIANLIDSIHTLRTVHGIGLGELAKACGYQFDTDGATLFRVIRNGNLDIKELNRIAQMFGLEPYIIFRPRVLRKTVERREGNEL